MGSYPTRNSSPLTIYSPNHYTADLLENPALEPSRKSPRRERKSLYFAVSILLEKVTRKIKHYLWSRLVCVVLVNIDILTTNYSVN